MKTDSEEARKELTQHSLVHTEHSISNSHVIIVNIFAIIVIVRHD